MPEDRLLPAGASVMNPSTDVEFAIVGAGLSGLCMAMTLQRAGRALRRACAFVRLLVAQMARLVDSIVAKPRYAVSLGKQLFYRQLQSGVEAAYADAARTMACNMMHGSALEGEQAFIDKRPPGSTR